MRYKIILAPEAREDLRRSRPQYRLRVEDVRVFYDVTERTVEVLAIVPKSEADAWLSQAGEPTIEEETDEESGAV